MAARERAERGETTEEAKRAARREFGNVGLVKETVRDAWGWRWLEDFLEDVRYGLRMLRKNPGFTAVAILSLALGIGANTAIFTLINDLMLKSLQVREPQQLVAFGKEFGGGVVDGIGPGDLDLFPYELYKQMEGQHEGFQGITAYGSFIRPVSVRLSGTSASPASQAISHLVSGNFFSVLGANTLLGRPLDPSDDDTPGRSPVAVLSYHYWQQSSSGDPGVISRTIILNHTPFTIIGVMPPNFYGIQIDADPPDMWLPLTMQEQVTLSPSLIGPRGLYWLHLMGRSKPGVGIKQAQEWVNLRLRQYMREREGAQLTPGRSQEIEKIYVDLRPGARGVSNLRVLYEEPLRILMSVVVLVLLIACGNLANFLLAKTASREREISTRLALGAGPGRVIRQILTETLLLSFLGGAAGLLLAMWGTQALLNFVVAGSAHTPFDPNPDARVLAFTFVVSLATGILFGLAPALRVSRMNLVPGLKAKSRSVTGDGSGFGGLLPGILVASQVTLSLVLLVGAGLFVRTLRNLQNQDFGFNRRNVLLGFFNPNIAGYKPEQVDSLYQRILERMNALPGVRSATLSGAPPIDPGSWNSPIFVKGRPFQPNENIASLINGVAPRYFETLGIPVLLGRPIGPQDIPGSAQVVVVNETFASYFFPRGDAIGQHLSVADPSVKGEWEIAGVVKNSKYNSPRETAKRMIYLPVAQLSGTNRYALCLQLLTEGDPAKLTEQARRAFAQIDGNLPLDHVKTITKQVDGIIDHEILISQLSSFFSLLALLLACIGLYGVMTFNVVRRTNEIGIRMALGAQEGGVLWMVLKESLVLLGIGIAIGVPVAVAVTRLVQTQLFGLSPSDPFTLMTAVFIVAAVTLLAGYAPARRATKVDPMVALRYE